MLRLLLRLQKKYVVDEKEVENKLYSIKDNEEKEDNNLKGEIKNTIDITEFYEQSKYPSFVDFEEKPLFEENKTKEVISKDTNISDKENIVDKSIFDKISNMRFIGTAFKAYAMFESGDTIFVMDTHASHERVLYDEYLREYQNEDVRTQILAAPFVLELGVTLKDVCINNLESLKKLGYEIEDFSGSNVIIREIPEMLSIEDTKEIVLNILSTLKNTSVLSNDINRNERLIKSACHHAVRGHDDISESEARKLLNDLKKSDNPFSCPHSRPTISKIKKKYFEKNVSKDLDMNKVIVIAGPTASGKSGLSIDLAKDIDAQIISADSVQVYKYMDIGSAKVTKEEMQGIKHYLVDEFYPDEKFKVSVFVERGIKYINEILRRGKDVIIVGGSGLYVDALIYDSYEFKKEDSDNEYRKYLENLAKEKGKEYIYNMLLEVDEESAKEIHPNNLKRVIRALEIYKNTGKKKSELNVKKKKYRFDNTYYFCLNDDRQKLYDGIDLRVDKMVEDGLVDEV